MENDKKAGHQAAILDQFTRQAVPFSQQPVHSQEAFLDLLLQISGVGPADTVLDVACGPGLVACAFAARAQHVTGIDLTPAMIARAKQIQQERKLTNLTWQVGDVLPLPYPDASFSLVITRYTFHHFLDPRAVFAEMVRVCTRGEGRVLVADVAVLPRHGAGGPQGREVRAGESFPYPRAGFSGKSKDYLRNRWGTRGEAYGRGAS